MRIVGREEFLEMPAGTLFAFYHSTWDFHDLCIKGETIGSADWGDFRFTSLLRNPESPEDILESGDIAIWLMEREQKGDEFNMDLFIGERDGMFEEDALFAVYNTQDTRALGRRILRLCGDLADEMRSL